MRSESITAVNASSVRPKEQTLWLLWLEDGLVHVFLTCRTAHDHLPKKPLAGCKTVSLPDPVFIFLIMLLWI